jgi:predicted ATPase/transcriptional regulator with XRE-family HTH domain
LVVGDQCTERARRKRLAATGRPANPTSLFGPRVPGYTTQVRAPEPRGDHQPSDRSVAVAGPPPGGRDPSPSFGNELRRLRLRAGLTQEGLAERAGLGVATIGALEEGRRRRPYPSSASALAEALALAPADRTALLELASGASARPDSAGPPPLAAEPSRPAARMRLPVPLTELIGREAEVVAAAALLDPARSALRLLTLTGPGGVGKTRLALAVAAAVAGAYPDGVTWVDLAPLRDARLVPATTARAMDLRESRGGSSRELLLEHLRERRLMLVLDNCEHLPGAASVLAELLEGCPHLAMLVTSRAALRLRGERRFPVEPLAAPPEGSASFAAIVTAPAVRLFVERARAVAPDFALDAGNAGVVAAVCRRLDGMPLALELAAARVQLLAPGALLRRLDRRLSLLTGGAADLPERQRALRTTLAWSHNLLGPVDQLLFRRLAVFAGGWTVEAAEAVCGDADLPADDLLERLGVLVDSSLARRIEGGGEPRFGMLETVREYAEEQLLASGDAETVRARHRDWCLALAAAAEPALAGHDQLEWLARLDAERDNLRAALEWSLADEGGGEAGLRLAGALWWFWFAWGHLAEGRQWLDRMLARTRPSDPSSRTVQARALLGAGHLARFQGDWAGAGSYSERSLALCEAAGDASGMGYALHSLGVLAQLEGDWGRARALMERSLAHFRDAGNEAGHRDVRWHLGLVARLEGDYARARTIHDENLTVCRAIGDRRGVAKALVQLGLLALRITGDGALAEALCGESLVVCREIGDTPGMGYALVRLGNLAGSVGNHARARALHREGLERFRDVMDRRQLATGLSFCGSLAVRDGSPARGVRLFGAADALDSLYRTSLDPVERGGCDAGLAAARAALGEDAFAEAWADGRVMALGQAIALATEDGASSGRRRPSNARTPRT